MGMPGSETALEELMSPVLSNLLQDSIIAKVTDDLCCVGKSSSKLLYNWKSVFSALQTAGLTLSTHKTSITPKSTTVFGWI